MTSILFGNKDPDEEEELLFGFTPSHHLTPALHKNIFLKPVRKKPVKKKPIQFKPPKIERGKKATPPSEPSIKPPPITPIGPPQFGNIPSRLPPVQATPVKFPHKETHRPDHEPNRRFKPPSVIPPSLVPVGTVPKPSPDTRHKFGKIFNPSFRG